MHLTSRAAAPVVAIGLAVSTLSSPAGAVPDTGFTQPFAGDARYLRYAPREATTSKQINRPLGMKKAHRIARKLGLRQRHVFTPHQYRLFVSGRGVGGDRSAAKLVDQSVRILTNTKRRPLIAKIDGHRVPSVLAGYGLMVDRAGLLESPANSSAPTRQVNSVIEPGGYMPKWCRQNGARDSLRMLNRSAYLPEAVYGNQAQLQSGVAQLVPNVKSGRTATVGMSMAPSIWVVNFALIYMLKPQLAAKMPARWTPIPPDVAQAIADSPTGQVPYLDYRSQLSH
ncbi:MAG: hypothetical protein U0R64_01835 [Candidatus Nanopelagicales bacterium]